MPALELVLILLAAAAALNVLARRLEVPHPVLLVIGGAILAFVPGLPRPRIDPDAVFLIFIPPLLYWTAVRTSWRDFTRHLRPILLLSVPLVLVTMAAIALVAHAIAPELTWPAAFVLGAIVSPPDPVAVTALTRRLRLPGVIVTLLEGEGLVNDATALVAYRMAVAAAVAGTFSISQAGLRFVWSAGGGILIGLVAGKIIYTVRRWLEPVPVVQNTISLLTPFAAFIPAERLGCSGVLAVVAIGLYLGRLAPRAVSPQTRIQWEGIWEMATFVLEGLIFILTGLSLPAVLVALQSHPLSWLLGRVALVSLVAVVVRIAWVAAAAYLPRVIDRARGKKTELPPPRQVFFTGWAGLRGADSLVIALALPIAAAANGTGAVAANRGVPGRDLIIFLTFGVIAFTLILQGVTLRWVIRALHLAPDGTEEEEERVGRLQTAQAALKRLDQLEKGKRRSEPEVIAELRETFRHRLHRYDAGSCGKEHARDERVAADYRRIRLAVIAAERKEIVRLRDHDVVNDKVMRLIQKDLDLEQVLLEGFDVTEEPEGS